MTNDSGAPQEELAQRIDRVEEALGLKAPALEKRLEKVETQIQTLSGKSRPNPWLTILDYLIKIVGTLTPVIVLFVGFMIKDSIDLAIKERELSIKEARLKIDEAQALDTLLKNFRKSNISVDEAHRTALMILDYGNVGIRALIQDLNAKPEHRVRAQQALHALKIHAVMSDNQKLFCSLLGRIKDMQPSAFSAEGLQRVSTLSEAIGCGDIK